MAAILNFVMLSMSHISAPLCYPHMKTVFRRWNRFEISIFGTVTSSSVIFFFFSLKLPSWFSILISISHIIVGCTLEFPIPGNMGVAVGISSPSSFRYIRLNHISSGDGRDVRVVCSNPVSTPGRNSSLSSVRPSVC